MNILYIIIPRTRFIIRQDDRTCSKEYRIGNFRNTRSKQSLLVRVYRVSHYSYYATKLKALLKLRITHKPARPLITTLFCLICECYYHTNSMHLSFVTQLLYFYSENSIRNYRCNDFFKYYIFSTIRPVSSRS